MRLAATVLGAAFLTSGAAMDDHASPDAPYHTLSAAYDALDPALAASAYHADAVYAGPGRPDFIEGDGIEAAFGFLAGAADRGAALDLDFKVVRRGLGPEAGGDAGFYRLIVTEANGESRANYGKFITVLVHGDNGWVFMADGFSGADAAAWEAAECAPRAPCTP